MYNSGGPDYVHGDIHRIEFYKGTSDDVIFCTDGGVFETDMGTASNPVFYERNNGYNTLQYYTCAFTPNAGEDLTLGGCQDNCTLFYDGQPITVGDVMSGGDGAYCFIDKNEPNIWLTSYQYNRYFIYVNGNTVANISNFAMGNFICPADYDYMNNALYANVVSFFGFQNQNRLLRVTDIPNSNNAGILDVGTTSNMPFTNVKYSQYSTPGTSTLFLGTQSGEIFKVENAESVPQATDLTGANLPVGYISGIDLIGSEDTILISFSNYGIESVWQTCDGGNNWVSKEGNLPDMPIRWVLYHPDNANQALLATELGVWATTNLQQSDVYWEPVNDGMANVRVDMLRFRESDNKVVAASHGRGLFYADFVLAPVGIHERDHEIAEFNLYPNPATTHINCQFQIPDSEFQICIYDLRGTIVDVVEVPQGASEIQIDVSGLAKGTYFATAKSENKVTGRAKFIKE
ncbi:T9SS type A sorting domain-containing protein, partial [Bacteroidota bacterium]